MYPGAQCGLRRRNPVGHDRAGYSQHSGQGDGGASSGTDLGTLTADILDENGRILKSVEINGGAPVALGSEETGTFTADIDLEGIEGTPASVSLRGSEEEVPEFVGHALVLSGEIGVKFRVDFKNERLAKNARISFSAADGRTSSMSIAEATQDDENENSYWFTCYVNALENDDKITAALRFGDDQVINDEYSVMDYCRYVQTNSADFSPRLLELVNAITRRTRSERGILA